jgi:glutaredoxin
MKNKLLPISVLAIILLFAAAAFVHNRQKPQSAENGQASQEPAVANQPAQDQPGQSTSSPKQAVKAQPPQTKADPRQPNQVVKSDGQYILFYSVGCPHCAKVEAFIQQNGIANKLPLQNKEVYYDSDNAALLVEIVTSCGMPTGSIDVPFLYDGSQCIVGDADIISFFQQKLNI